MSMRRHTCVYRELENRTDLELQGGPFQKEVCCPGLTVSADTSHRSDELLDLRASPPIQPTIVEARNP